MTAVKGSKAYNLKVVKDRPRLRAAVFVLAAVLAIVGGEFLYTLGFKLGVAGQDKANAELLKMREELDDVLREKKQLSQELENTRLGVEVDQHSLEKIRHEVFELKSTIAELEESNKVYRNLMAPSGNKRGLTFGPIELARIDDRIYRFKVVMWQLTATSHQLLNGSLNFNVVGKQYGEVAVYPLKDLSKDIDSSNIKLRFKYFQELEGEILLPEGFEPQRIELEARSTGKSPTTIEKRFEWLAEEA